MKKLSTMMADLSVRFGNGKSAMVTVKKKKTFMFEALHDVEERIVSSSLDEEISKEKLDTLKEEFSQVSQGRHEAVGRLRDIQTKLKFITRTSEHLRLKQAEVEEEIHTLVEMKKRLAVQEAIIDNEGMPGQGIADMKKKTGVLEEGNVSLLETVASLDSDHCSLTELKNVLCKESSAIENQTRRFQDHIPLLRTTKSKREAEIAEIESLKERYSEAEEEQKRLVDVRGEKTEQVKKQYEELDGLNKKKTVLQDQCFQNQSEKERLILDIEDMEGRKEKVEGLQSELEDVSAARDEKVYLLEETESRLDLVGKESGDLEKDLEASKVATTALQQEKQHMEDSHSSTIDIMTTVNRVGKQCAVEKEKYEQLIEQTISVQEEIRTAETEIHYYKNALGEIAQGMGA